MHAAGPVTGQTPLSPASAPKMAGNKPYTIVEYFGGDEGYRCGYCKNEKGNFSHGECPADEAAGGARRRRLRVAEAGSG